MALLLTAIVISFGVTAFLIVLAARGYEETRNVNLGEAAAVEGEE
jgi:multisubunit Na+/H+ antiporter MnhC subunit